MGELPTAQRWGGVGWVGGVDAAKPAGACRHGAGRYDRYSIIYSV